MASNYQLMVRDEVLSSLEVEPATIRELADKFKRNYYTVRLVVRDLQDEGLVKPVASHTFRNVKFTVGSDGGTNNIIPNVVDQHGKKFKLTALLQLRFQKNNTSAAHAVNNIPKHIARILATSIRVHRNGVEPTTTLSMVKEEMLADRQALQTAINIYDQLLANPKNWSLESLKRYPLDATFDEAEVMNAYHDYYAPED